jgi:hypothetical protein
MLFADQLYGMDSAQWSPSGTPDVDNDQLGRPMVASGSPNPEARDQVAAMGYVGLPPDPSAGGQPGISRMFGWTTGLLPSRTMRQPLGGATLVRPSMGAHPNVGPVGFSTWTDRREAGVAALYDEWLPSARTIQESFTKPRGS